MLNLLREGARIELLKISKFYNDKSNDDFDEMFCMFIMHQANYTPLISYFTYKIGLNRDIKLLQRKYGPVI